MTGENREYKGEYCTSPSDTLRKLWENIGAQGVQELFFCELKAPGGCSTRWTLNSYRKGNSFMYTGHGFQSMSL